MVRAYERKLGARGYKNYTEDALQSALQDRASCPKKLLQKNTKWTEQRLYKINNKHQGKPGRSTVLTEEEEKLLSETLGIISDWQKTIYAV